MHPVLAVPGLWCTVKIKSRWKHLVSCGFFFWKMREGARLSDV